MLKPEQVPDDVVRRFATWQFPKCTDKLMRSMLADAISAWPGMQTDCERRVSEKWIGVREFPVIILPLHQEIGE